MTNNPSGNEASRGLYGLGYGGGDYSAYVFGKTMSENPGKIWSTPTNSVPGNYPSKAIPKPYPVPSSQIFNNKKNQKKNEPELKKNYFLENKKKITLFTSAVSFFISALLLSAKYPEKSLEVGSLFLMSSVSLLLIARQLIKEESEQKAKEEKLIKEYIEKVRSEIPPERRPHICPVLNLKP